ncbi:hypothetical protein LCGC14_2211070, partial [marine sediment metagenome]
QVAFKEAASDRRVLDILDLSKETAAHYQLLMDLHTSLGIEADESAPRGGGGGGGGFTPKPRMATPASAIAFTIADGSQWLDYRASKVDGSVKPKFPDFKTADGKESVYEFGLDGAPTPQFAELAAAADGITALTDPF